MSLAYFPVSLICIAYAAYGTGLQKDTLMELSFHIPTTNTTYLGDEERPPAQVLLLSLQQLMYVYLLNLVHGEKMPVICWRKHILPEAKA